MTGEPLPLAVSVAAPPATGLYVLLALLVLLIAMVAVVAAALLAHSPPGRSPIWPGPPTGWPTATWTPGCRSCGNDEVGRLAGTFNRMTRELQAYVQALTASRDQLRGHLAILGDTLSSTHDLHRILRSSCGPRWPRPAPGPVWCCWSTRPAGTWSPSAGRGCPTRVWHAADRRQPDLLGCGRASRGGRGAGRSDRGADPDLRPAEPACRTYVAVPIWRRAPWRPAGPAPGDRPGDPPATLGVLALYDRVGGDDVRRRRPATPCVPSPGRPGWPCTTSGRHEEAQRLSLTDPLTGLWNYRYLRESLRREVERASRFGRMLTVLVLDLDHFKQVNDTYGHAAGDTVLGEFARRMRSGLREVDVAFRQGGEEFVVLLPETDAYGGTIVAERLGAAVRRPTFGHRATTAGRAGAARMRVR